MKGLKNIARELSIPVVVLAQVSRQVETGGKGREPRLGDLSDSSEIEKEADQVLMLYRDEYYNPEPRQRVEVNARSAGRPSRGGSVNR